MFSTTTIWYEMYVQTMVNSLKLAQIARKMVMVRYYISVYYVCAMVAFWWFPNLGWYDARLMLKHRELVEVVLIAPQIKKSNYMLEADVWSCIASTTKASQPKLHTLLCSNRGSGKKAVLLRSVGYIIQLIWYFVMQTYCKMTRFVVMRWHEGAIWHRKFYITIFFNKL